MRNRWNWRILLIAAVAANGAASAVAVTTSVGGGTFDVGDASSWGGASIPDKFDRHTTCRVTAFYGGQNGRNNTTLPQVSRSEATAAAVQLRQPRLTLADASLKKTATASNVLSSLG